MAGKQPVIVIKKKKGGHHGGAHGGAWKVAYADFVTAMMAFFLVMWLMGSDEEIKASISTYFNNPTTAWRPDMQEGVSVPLGNKTGAGESVINGLEGLMPDSLVDRPNREINQYLENDQKVKNATEDAIENQLARIVEIDELKFSLREDLLFEKGSDEITQEGSEQLKRLAEVFKKYDGQVIVTAISNPVDPYESTMAKAVNIAHHMVGNKWVDSERISSKVAAPPALAPGERAPASRAIRKIEFLLKK